MDRKSAVKLVNSEIKGYKLQRSNTIYNDMGIDSLAETFRINMGNIAMLPEPAIKIGTAIAFAISAVYLQKTACHSLTKKINKLRELKSTIYNTDFIDDMNEEELDAFVKTKNYTK